MRVGVTGAAGYIGGWLTAELHSRGHEVFAQDIAWPCDLHEKPDFAWPFERFNLCDDEKRYGWIHNNRLEVVVHLAAVYGRVWGERNMTRTAGINAGLTGSLARDCTCYGARLMFMSSSEVYGTSAGLGPELATWVELRPLNMYGLSKKWGEEAARLYAGDGLQITRLNMPYGPPKDTPVPGQRPHTSGIPGIVGYNVLHSMCWQAEYGIPLRVHAGTSRCLTWVGDSARGLAMILESGKSGVWNVCRNDQHYPVEELARMVKEMTGSKSPVRLEPIPLGVTQRKDFDNTELLDLGWRPKVDLEDGMKQTWEYFRRFDPDGVWRG